MTIAVDWDVKRQTKQTNKQTLDLFQEDAITELGERVAYNMSHDM